MRRREPDWLRPSHPRHLSAFSLHPIADWKEKKKRKHRAVVLIRKYITIPPPRHATKVIRKRQPALPTAGLAARIVQDQRLHAARVLDVANVDGAAADRELALGGGDVSARPDVRDPRACAIAGRGGRGSKEEGGEEGEELHLGWALMRRGLAVGLVERLEGAEGWFYIYWRLVAQLLECYS